MERVLIKEDRTWTHATLPRSIQSGLAHWAKFTEGGYGTLACQSQQMPDEFLSLSAPNLEK